MNKILQEISLIWDEKDLIKNTEKRKKDAVELINNFINLINTGQIRAANKHSEKWIVEENVKKAIILYFFFSDSELINIGESKFYDKIPLKTTSYSEEDFQKTNSRFVPGSIIRNGVYIGNKVVVMPSFINIGSYIDDMTMIDSCVTIGSCAQIGKSCHISSNVTIGGVLEPIGAKPVIIEDNCFIGAGSQVLEGVLIEENSIIGSGVILSASTRIIYRNTGEVIYGNIPKNSVVVSGSYGGDGAKIPSISCAVIIKNINEEIRSKLSINEILRN
jgi:2,3,4,5-tetrahydropyridine-2-carboxylate N-succinyltransferase